MLPVFCGVKLLICFCYFNCNILVILCSLLCMAVSRVWSLSLSHVWFLSQDYVFFISTRIWFPWLLFKVSCLSFFYLKNIWNIKIHTNFHYFRSREKSAKRSTHDTDFEQFVMLIIFRNCEDWYPRICSVDRIHEN